MAISIFDLFKQSFEKYLEGYSYDSIANILNTQVKSVDNAIQRIRKKALKNISDVDIDFTFGVEQVFVPYPPAL